MQRKDLPQLLLLMILVPVLYYPVFSSEYLYTDEAVQLWHYKPGADYHMFLPQGRYITDLLFQFLFSRADTVHDVIYIRLFSLTGWLVCIPVWFYIFKRIARDQSLPAWLPFLTTLYLICTPAFSISIGWASCLELFVANTAGLLSGYFFYQSISPTAKGTPTKLAYIFGSIVLGLVSLFTYQNGFGCFILPFVLLLIAKPGKWKNLFFSIGFYLLVSSLYFILFKIQLNRSGITEISRTGIEIHFINKVKFFLSKPLTAAYHFNYLITETSIAGVIASMVLLGGTFGLYYVQLKKQLHYRNACLQMIILVVLWVMIYLPSLLVKENYSSNRTMLALSMGVFIFIIVLFAKQLQGRKGRLVMIGVCSLLVANAVYNFHFNFLKPVVREYQLLRPAIISAVKPGVDTVYLIQPAEDFYVKKLGLTRSWDEYGVPSIFFGWVPEFFIKQVIYEQTRDRAKANQLVIQSEILENDKIDGSNSRSSKAGTAIINTPVLLKDQ